MKGALQELNEEYEDLESISKIQTQILNLSGVNIFDPNGNFRDTYDILKDISEVYNDLADKDKASLDTILFGTTRSNQGQALLKAFQSGQIQKALKDIENSAGTAEAEFAKYEKSIEAVIQTNKAAAQELAMNLIDDDTIKGFVNAGTTFLNILNDIISKFGTLNTLIPTIAFGLSAFKNVGRHKMSCLVEYADCNVVVTRNELIA